jgi:hypothetical protein
MSELSTLLKKPTEKGNHFALDSAIMAAAVPAGLWRLVTDEEHPQAIAALTKLIGREAKLPSWQRRLGTMSDGKGWILAIDALSPLYASPAPSAKVTTIRIGLPLAIGVEVLQSANSPEAEATRRQKAHEEHLKAEAEAKRIADEKAAAEVARTRKEREDRANFRADDWAAATPLERFCGLLALAVEKRDPKLAADVRAACAGAQNATDFPKAAWFEGIGVVERLQPAKDAEALKRATWRAEQLIMTIPTDRLALLEVKHGKENVLAIVEEWERIRGSVPRTDPVTHPTVKEEPIVSMDQAMNDRERAALQILGRAPSRKQTGETTNAGSQA